MAVKTIRNVNLCPGRSHPKKMSKLRWIYGRKGNKLVCANEQCGFVKIQPKDKGEEA